MRSGVPYSKGTRKNQFTGSYGNFKPSLVESKNGLRYPTDIVYFKTPESEEEATVWHPTQKPVGLGRYLVRTFSNEGDVVLDNTFGAGSFLVSALLENRNFIGIEKNQDARLFKEDYVDLNAVARERLKNAFLSNPTTAFSPHIKHTGVIKEFCKHGKRKATV